MAGAVDGVRHRLAAMDKMFADKPEPAAQLLRRYSTPVAERSGEISQVTPQQAIALAADNG